MKLVYCDSKNLDNNANIFITSEVHLQICTDKL